MESAIVLLCLLLLIKSLLICLRCLGPLHLPQPMLHALTIDMPAEPAGHPPRDWSVLILGPNVEVYSLSLTDREDISSSDESSEGDSGLF